MSDQPPAVGSSMEDAERGIRDAVRTNAEGKIERTICGGRFTVLWQGSVQGSKSAGRGLPLTTFCAEPLCITQGHCTGPRFVASPQQYTTEDSDDPKWGPRNPDTAELIAGFKQAAYLATKAGAAPLEPSWNNTRIARFIGHIWQMLGRALRGDGEWQ